MPWIEVAYWVTSFSWHAEHCAGASFEGCCASLMSTWQSTQLILPCTDFAKSSGRTPIHTGCSPFLRGLNSASWQSRHSLLATTGFFASGAVTEVSLARPKQNESEATASARVNETKRGRDRAFMDLSP